MSRRCTISFSTWYVKWLKAINQAPLQMHCLGPAISAAIPPNSSLVSLDSCMRKENSFLMQACQNQGFRLYIAWALADGYAGHYGLAKLGFFECYDIPPNPNRLGAGFVQSPEAIGSWFGEKGNVFVKMSLFFWQPRRVKRQLNEWPAS
jgi:hypothetical protein